MSVPVIPVGRRGSAKTGGLVGQPSPGGQDLNGGPSGQVILATAGYDHTIKFWEVGTGQCLKTLQHADSQVNALEISPDGQLLAACGYQHIRMFDVLGTNPNPVVNYEGVSKNVMDVGFQEECKWMYTAGEDGTVKIWDLGMRNLSCQRIYDAHAPVNSAVLHPNQQDLILGDQNGVVHVWNLRSDHSEQYLAQPGCSVQSVAVDSQGLHMACVTNLGTLHVWDFASGGKDQTVAEQRQKITAHKRYGLKCKFSPDSSALATTSADQSTKLWRPKDLTHITDLHKKNQRWVWDMAFSNDSQYLFTASSDGVARLWSLAKNEVKCEYVGHSKALTCLAFKDRLLP